MTLRSAHSIARVNDFSSLQQSPTELSPQPQSSVISPYSSQSASGESSPIMRAPVHVSYPVPCVPSQRWISCWVEVPAGSICVARVVPPVFDRKVNNLVYHV